VLRTADVGLGRVLRVRLRAVDVGPGSRVQDEIDVAQRRRGVLDVPVFPPQAARIGEGIEQRCAELAAGAGYDDASRAERMGDVVLQT